MTNIIPIDVEKDIASVTEPLRGNSGYSISDLSPQQARFVHLYLTGQYTNQKIAQLLDVHVNTIGNWLMRKDVRGCIADMQEITQEVVGNQLKNLTLKAINKLNSLIDSPIDGVALNAVKDVLDRAGHKPKQEIKIDKTVTFEEKLKSIIDSVDVEYEILDDKVVD